MQQKHQCPLHCPALCWFASEQKPASPRVSPWDRRGSGRSHCSLPFAETASKVPAEMEDIMVTLRQLQCNQALHLPLQNWAQNWRQVSISISQRGNHAICLKARGSVTLFLSSPTLLVLQTVRSPSNSCPLLVCAGEEGFEMLVWHPSSATQQIYSKGCVVYNPLEARAFR